MTARLDFYLAPLGRDCRVYLNGVDVSSQLTGFSINADVDYLTTVTLVAAPVAGSAGGDVVAWSGRPLDGIERLRRRLRD